MFIRLKLRESIILNQQERGNERDGREIPRERQNWYSNSTFVSGHPLLIWPLVFCRQIKG